MSEETVSAETSAETACDRKRVWGWWFFDWASQPYATLLMTFIFPIYYMEAAQAHFLARGFGTQAALVEAQALWGYVLTTTGVLIAIFAPLLGALADATGRRLVWIWGFSLLYVLGASGLWFLLPDGSHLMLALWCFGLGLIGMEFTAIFTNAMLPDLAPRRELGRISGAGYAFGYLGGVVALALTLLLLAENSKSGLTILQIPPILGLDASAREGTRAAGPLTALWYLVFMIPFALWLREPATRSDPARTRQGIGAAFASLIALLRSLRHRPSLSAWLVSSMFSRDALNALYAFGGVYAAGVLGWPVMLAGIFGVASAVSAALITWLGGYADRRWGPRPVIVVASLVLIAVSLLMVGMTREQLFGLPFASGSRLPDALFFACGMAIGGAGGSLQAASRTLMALHTTPERAAEAFGLYALSGKATAFLAPLLVAIVTGITASPNFGISPLIVMFTLALILLIWVKPEGETPQ